jgi:hypothetical protein
MQANLVGISGRAGAGRILGLARKGRPLHEGFAREGDGSAYIVGG